MSMDMQRFHATFFEESREGLEAMEAGLLQLEQGDRDADLINSIFRAAHSIKGGAATFGFDAVAALTHVLETLLDELREHLEQPSTYEDGLSFGQANWAKRSFGADRFATVSTTDEPLDAVVFSDGIVPAGETVTVTAMITDYTPLQEFFLLQRREAPVAALPALRLDG